MNVINRIGIVGSGTMGHGIAHVAALAGNDVALYDIDADRVAAALGKVRGNLDKGVEKGKAKAPSQEEAEQRRRRDEEVEDWYAEVP